jgi:hypothetical protein
MPGRVTGRIVRVIGDGDRPVGGAWVVLHGIGSSGGRAVDSVRTSPSGEFRIRYERAPDSTNTQYFVSTVHDGIAYVSGILPPEATPDDATLTVFDTTSAALHLDVRGRHILVFAPADGPRRRVAEIYDLSNDTTLTRVTRDGGPPVWTGLIPRGYEEFSSGPDLASNEAIRVVDGRVAAYAPVAPGLKRLAFTYALPPAAFPVRFPMEQPTQLLEVLLEDREGDVTGGGLTEIAPTTIEGRTFRRFQAQDVPASGVIVIDVPAAPLRRDVPRVAILVAIAAVMIGALALALARRRRLATATPLPPARVDDPADALAREIADLDAAFAAQAQPTVTERDAYEHRRAVLKRALTERLARRRGP